MNKKTSKPINAISTLTLTLFGYFSYTFYLILVFFFRQLSRPDLWADMKFSLLEAKLLADFLFLDVFSTKLIYKHKYKQL